MSASTEGIRAPSDKGGKGARYTRTLNVRAVRIVVRRVRRESPQDSEPQEDRPRKRSDCANVPRPCPYVGCRYHLYLDVTPRGGIQFNFPNLEPCEMPHSCALDVAEDGQHTLDEVSKHTNLTRERTRQIEETAKHKLTVLQPRTVAMLRELGESE